MNPLRTLVACALAASATLLTACEPSRHAVEIDYTFGGRDCASAGVATIQIDVAGEVLNPNQYRCADANKGVAIGRYLNGTYNVTVSGFDTGGNVIYQTVQAITVSGGTNIFAIDAAPVNQGGSITILWRFAGQTCAQSGVTAVRVTLDGALVADGSNNVNLPCNSAGEDGTTISGVDAGVHRIDLQAVRGGQVAYTLGNLTATVQDGFDTELDPNLIASSTSSASALVRWTFAGMSCADAKVSSVRLTIDSATALDVPCNANGSDGSLISNLTAGNHSFSVQGVRSTASGNILAYASTTATLATFSVGLTTQVLIDAPSATPGVGGARLLFQFPAGGPLCSNAGGPGTSISYTIRPAVGQNIIGTSTCGGASANLGIEFCYPSTASCSSLPAGYASIDATTTSGPSYHATGEIFAVPNGDSATTNIVFQ